MFRAGPLAGDPSDRALARAAGVSPSTIGDWLQGRRFPQDSLPGPDAGHPLHTAAVILFDSVPAACPIGQQNGVIHGHSRIQGHTA